MELMKCLLCVEQVFLYIYGTEQNWTSVHLQARQKSNASGLIDGFPSGSTRTFCLRGPDIGQLHHLNVNVKEDFHPSLENFNVSLM